jgi:hypothetical protein
MRACACPGRGPCWAYCDRPVVALQEPKCHQRVEEILGRARMDAQPVPQILTAFRVPRQLGEQLHLDRAQKGLRGPEAEADLHDLIWCRIFTHVLPLRWSPSAPAPAEVGSIMSDPYASNHRLEGSGVDCRRARRRSSGLGERSRIHPERARPVGQRAAHRTPSRRRE